MLFTFLTWWYGPGWLAAFNDIQKRTVEVTRSFSVVILLKTLFAPWKRIVSQPGAGLDAKFKAMLDNLISRFVGFSVRIIVLISALLLAVGSFIFFGIIALIWPLLPLGILLCIAKVIVG